MMKIIQIVFISFCLFYLCSCALNASKANVEPSTEHKKNLKMFYEESVKLLEDLDNERQNYPMPFPLITREDVKNNSARINEFEKFEKIIKHSLDGMEYIIVLNEVYSKSIQQEIRDMCLKSIKNRIDNYVKGGSSDFAYDQQMVSQPLGLPFITTNEKKIMIKIIDLYMGQWEYLKSYYGSYTDM